MFHFLKSHVGDAVLAGIAMLAAAFALSLTIAYVSYYESFESWISDRADIVRIETTLQPPGSPPFSPVSSPRAAMPFLRGVLDAEAVTGFSTRPVHALTADRFIDETLTLVEPGFLSLFPLSSDGIGPDEVLLSEAAAARYFGMTDVIGRTYVLPSVGVESFLVKDVFALPPTTHLAADVVIRNPEPLAEDRSREAWTSLDTHVYARLKSQDTLSSLPTALDEYLGPQVTGTGTFEPSDIWRFDTTPIEQIAFEGDRLGSLKPSVTRGFVSLVRALGLSLGLIILFGSALTMHALNRSRRKEFQLRATFGEDTVSRLGTALLPFAVCVAIPVATGVALAAVGVQTLGASADGFWTGLTGSAVSLSLLICLGLSVLGAAIAAGSLVASANAPLIGDKGRVGGRQLVEEHVGLLMVSTFAAFVIVGSAILLVEMVKLRSQDKGFAIEGVYALEEAGAQLGFKERLDGVRAEILSNAFVSDMAFTSALPGRSISSFGAIVRADRPEDPPVTVAVIAASPNLPDLLNSGVISGRALEGSRPADVVRFEQAGGPQSSVLNALGNEALAAAVGLSESQLVGTTHALTGYAQPVRIVGILPDWRLEGLQVPVQPAVFVADERLYDHAVLAVARASGQGLANTLEDALPGLSNKLVPLRASWNEQFAVIGELLTLGLLLAFLVGLATVILLASLVRMIGQRRTRFSALSSLYGTGPFRSAVAALGKLPLTGWVGVASGGVAAAMLLDASTLLQLTHGGTLVIATAAVTVLLGGTVVGFLVQQLASRLSQLDLAAVLQAEA